MTDRIEQVPAFRYKGKLYPAKIDALVAMLTATVERGTKDDMGCVNISHLAYNLVSDPVFRAAMMDALRAVEEERLRE